MIKPYNNVGQVEKAVFNSIKHLMDAEQEKFITKMIIKISILDASYIKAIFLNNEEKVIDLKREDNETIFSNLKKSFEIPNFVQSLVINLESDKITVFDVSYIPLIDSTKDEEES